MSCIAIYSDVIVVWATFLHDIFVVCLLLGVDDLHWEKTNVYGKKKHIKIIYWPFVMWEMLICFPASNWAHRRCSISGAGGFPKSLHMRIYQQFSIFSWNILALIPNRQSINLLLFQQILYVLVSFFGTGNIASVSSFDTNWVRCFISTFAPFLMSSLIILKLLIPVLLVMCAVRQIHSVTKVCWTFNAFTCYKISIHQTI